jgi:hypothetical protein
MYVARLKKPSTITVQFFDEASKGYINYYSAREAEDSRARINYPLFQRLNSVDG